MEPDLARAIARSIVRLVIDLPLALMLIRIWVWCGAFELVEWPRPTWKQSIALAAMFTFIPSH